MAVLRNNKSRFATSILTMLVIGALTFAALIIGLASRLASEQGIQTARFGPFRLFEMYRVPAGNGEFSAGLNFDQGLVYYALFWLVLGVLLAVFRQLKYTKQ